LFLFSSQLNINSKKLFYPFSELRKYLLEIAKMVYKNEDDGFLEFVQTKNGLDFYPGHSQL